MWRQTSIKQIERGVGQNLEQGRSASEAGTLPAAQGRSRESVAGNVPAG